MNLSHVNNSTFCCTNDTVHAYVEGVAELSRRLGASENALIRKYSRVIRGEQLWSHSVRALRRMRAGCQ